MLTQIGGSQVEVIDLSGKVQGRLGLGDGNKPEVEHTATGWPRLFNSKPGAPALNEYCFAPTGVDRGAGEPGRGRANDKMFSCVSPARRGYY